jgi:CspA family cold shock protein
MFLGQRRPFDEARLFCLRPPELRAWTRQPTYEIEGPRSAAAACCPVEKIVHAGANMAVGTVKFFNTAKGYGFISPEGGGKDVFVHATAVEAAGMRTLNEGQKVAFDIQPDARGAKAVNLRAA